MSFKLHIRKKYDLLNNLKHIPHTRSLSSFLQHFHRDSRHYFCCIGFLRWHVALCMETRNAMSINVLRSDISVFTCHVLSFSPVDLFPLICQHLYRCFNLSTFLAVVCTYQFLPNLLVKIMYLSILIKLRVHGISFLR